MRRWLRRDYPAIAARAKAEGGAVFWGDETGLRSDDVRGRSYAPRGRTPEVRVNHKRANLGLISAVTNKGELRWMVLDGAIDMSLSLMADNLQTARGFETALRSYVANCVDQGDCFLGNSVDEGIERIQQFLAEVEEEPLPTDADRELTIGWATYGVWMPLYVESYWGQLTAGLKQAMEDGRGSKLLSLADLYTSRGSDLKYS